MNISQLRDRILAATGPDRELDTLLWEMADPTAATSLLRQAPAYTASVDLALALVGAKLPGKGWIVSNEGAKGFGASFEGRYFKFAPTAPLAILLSALTVLSEQGATDHPTHGDGG